jgi:hypothetical protein
MSVGETIGAAGCVIGFVLLLYMVLAVGFGL